MSDADSAADSNGAPGLDRRDFLRTLPAVGAALYASDAFRTPAQAGTQVRSIGIQAYTMRSVLSKDLEGTLAAIAKIGYREIEFAGLYGKSPAEMRAILDRVGLTAVSSHHSTEDIRGDWQKTLDGARTLGQSYVVVASVGGNDRTAEGLRAVADDFNKAGEAANKAGLRFGYHNHDFEFKPVDGLLPYDVLLERCDPSLVIMEMDLFWIVNGGQDPLRYFAKYPGRFPLVHAKDRTAGGEMVNVGKGVIDFRDIFAHATQAGIRHVFVEHDNPPSPVDDARVSFQALRRLGLGGG